MRRTRPLSFFLIAAMAIAACGGDDADCAAGAGDGAPSDDVTAIIQGHAAETLVPAEL